MREDISEGLKQALKARDQRRTATLRAINAAVQDRDIANRGDGKGPATNDEVLGIIQKMVKQREESFAIYVGAGRADLATVEKEEIDILNEFLPKPLTEEEVAAAITAAISAVGAEGPKDMGKVIAQLRADYPGRIDFGKVSGQVRSTLSA
ncbi:MULTISPECIES: GatB/YqeY domain-containing protein [unclassified Devosia]|uniref:GatB/YqeY domain-containing protein n=1 Tax=unclassified Devosia TaxID=196773 RepID=UPI00145E305B|nr:MULTISPECIES: GatB/YqeY domain-containing protein [unclassified Devosia]MBJ6986725.1 GatB/YqeY domain-containing protein [Devosia sp. MC521]QMW61757.1 GatB/YqeY domain-containing protein [Devosia sp. MC521]